MKLADSGWTFDNPGPLPQEAVEAFAVLVEGIRSQVEGVQGVRGIFADEFSKVHGVPRIADSAGVGLAFDDLRHHMHAAAANAPLFILAFMTGCRRLARQGASVPSDHQINGILERYRSDYRVEGDLVSTIDASFPFGARARKPLQLTYGWQGALEEAETFRRTVIEPARVERAKKTVTHANAPLRAFLCHSSGDKPAVRRFHQLLRDDGHDPWLDAVNLLPGEDWEAEIRKAVRHAHIVIVFLSHGSVTKAGFVQKEITFALDVADEQPEGRIFIIPARLDDCKVPERLGRWHWVNLFEDDGYAKLLAALRKRSSDL